MMTGVVDINSMCLYVRPYCFIIILNIILYGLISFFFPYEYGAVGLRINTMQCNATQRNATQRNATQRNATQRNATQRNATQRNVLILVCVLHTQRNATHATL